MAYLHCLTRYVFYFVATVKEKMVREKNKTSNWDKLLNSVYQKVNLYLEGGKYQTHYGYTHSLINSKNHDGIFFNVCVLMKENDLIEVIFCHHPDTLPSLFYKTS